MTTADVSNGYDFNRIPELKAFVNVIQVSASYILSSLHVSSDWFLFDLLYAFVHRQRTRHLHRQSNHHLLIRASNKWGFRMIRCTVPNKLHSIPDEVLAFYFKLLWKCVWITYEIFSFSFNHPRCDYALWFYIDFFKTFYHWIPSSSDWSSSTEDDVQRMRKVNFLLWTRRQQHWRQSCFVYHCPATTVLRVCL